MPSSFVKQERLSFKTYSLFGTWFKCLQIVCSISKCPKIEQDKNLSNFDKVRCQNNRNLKIYDFLQKLKRWSVSCYTDQLSANQIAGKPVRISRHIIMEFTKAESQ